MYLDLRAYFKRSSSKFYIALHIFRAYILCKAYDIQTPWSISQKLIRYLLRMVRFKKDVIARCLTHKSKCVIYLTVGDCCRFFPLHRMYEHVNTAVVIWCCSPFPDYDNMHGTLCTPSQVHMALNFDVNNCSSGITVTRIWITYAVQSCNVSWIQLTNCCSGFQCG